MKITEIYTKGKSDKGVEIPVEIIDRKEKPFIKIYGVDGEKCKEAMRLRSVENARILTLAEDKQNEAHEKADLSLVSEMICGWSFEDKCTKTNKIKLLQNSPAIFELVNKSVFKRSLFMGE